MSPWGIWINSATIAGLAMAELVKGNLLGVFFALGSVLMGALAIHLFKEQGRAPPPT